MRRFLPILGVLLFSAAQSHAHGMLIPDDKALPPLGMLNHKVLIAIEDQVATTKVEQTFRNNTDRDLEATYIFPVPKGASVNKFSMWVNGQETKGELVPADKAREIYNGIVRRTQDPGLLEYLGNDLLQVRVFPIPRNGDQKISLTYTSVASKDRDLVEYVYPLKTDGKATATLQEFSIAATIKSQHGIQNVYSPTHSLTIKRTNDKEVAVSFDRNQGLLDKDFELFYSLGQQDVGLTALMHRPMSTENGFFMLLVSPRVELSTEQVIPRDVVFVLDTSGSMRGTKLEQAKRALNYCLTNLSPRDRFAVTHFATTVNMYKDGLLEAKKEQIDQAVKWVDKLEATGGTAINDALLNALELRGKDEGRVFTIVFFTDGEPTVGEVRPEKILANVAAKNTANTRIFTFGVGYGSGAHDRLNASLLDGLAEQSRGFSTFVRPEEDIEAKVSAMYGKIANPVLTNLKLSVTNDMNISEVYPPQLPDLFHGGQLVVFGRYTGTGPGAIKLTGTVGKDTREFTFDTTFPQTTGDEHGFVEHLWARRKVGYLLDQVRTRGENKELVDEIVSLAKKYGITTPYTSFLIVPDGALPVLGMRHITPAGGRGGSGPEALQPSAPGAQPLNVAEFARRVQEKPGDLAQNRGKFEDDRLAKGSARAGDYSREERKVLDEAKAKKDAYDKARQAFGSHAYRDTQSGKLGVDLSEQTNNLRGQSRLEQTAIKNVNGRNCMEIGGVWIDEGFDPKMKTLTVKAQSDAYFAILAREPKMKDVFRLANHIVWVAPNGTALVIDTSDGKEKLDDKEIAALFAPRK